MVEWLDDARPYIFFVLGCVCAGFCYAWWRTRRPRYAIAAGVAAIAIVGFFFLGRFFESDGQQMVRKVQEVAAAVTNQDLVAAFANVSEDFRGHGMTKDEFKTNCQQRIAHGQVTKVLVWDLAAEDVSRANKTGVVEFRFKVIGNWGESPPNWFARAMFVLDPDGQWRIKNFEIYDSLNQSKTPIAIPGMGGR